VGYLAFDTDPGDKATVTLDYSVTPAWLFVDTLNSRIDGIVPEAMVGTTFRFRVIATDTHSDTTTFTSRAIRIEAETGVEEPAIPTEFSLSQNYPNPFNPSTTVEYTLPFEADAQLLIYDILGREVIMLDDGKKAAGRYQVKWDGRDNRGRQLPTGVYFYRVQANHLELTRKLVMVR